jgi:hypothetical protein
LPKLLAATVMSPRPEREEVAMHADEHMAA